MSIGRVLVTACVVLAVPGTALAQTDRGAAVRLNARSTSIDSAVSVTMRSPQSASRLTPRRMLRVGKWALFGVALGMGGYALIRSGDADEKYEALRRLCDADPERCRIDSGTYIDAGAEALYQSAILHDRRARIGIVAGQISLLGSVALFIADLGNDRGPSDIPYPETRSHRVTGIGIRLTR